MATPDVRVRFSAEGVRQIVSAIDQVRGSAQRASRAVNLVAGTFGVGFGAAAFVGIIRNAIEAGDAIGVFAEKTGLGARAASELAFAADKADVSAESLAIGIKGMQLALAGSGAESKKTTEALSTIGLTIDQLRGLRPEEQLERLADGIRRIEDPALRTRLAVDLFGKSGADLLPLLLRGSQGIRELRREAIALGKSLSDTDLEKLEQADDALKRMRASVDAAAKSMTVALAPSIVAVADALRRLAGGATEIERIEEKLSKLREFSAEGGFLNLGFDEALGTFAGSGEIDKRIQELERQRARLVAGIGRGVRGGRGFGADLPSTGGAAEPATAEVVKTKAPKALAVKGDLQDVLDDQRQALEAARDVSIQTGREVLELAGRERDAKLAALDEEITRRKLVLAIAGQLGDRETAQLDRFRELSTARIDFEDLQAQGEAALNALDRERTRIEQEVELGITSQVSGQAELVRIEKERVVVLRQLADALTRAAAATGDPALIAQASQFAQAITSIEVSIHNAVDEFAKMKTAAAEALYGGLIDFIDTMVSGADSVKGAFKSLADSVISAMRRMAAEALATQIFGLLSGMDGLGFLGKVLKKADGGLIRGPGSDRSDNIPALLSPGEYVVRAASVRRIGVDVLDQLNRGMRVRMPSYGIPRFAEGGLVGSWTSSASGDGVTIVNNVDARGSSLSRSEFDAALNRSSEVTIAKVRDLVHQGRL